MSSQASDIVKDSGTTPPATDDHTNRAVGEQIQNVDQQTHPHTKQGTSLQIRREPTVNGHAVSHPDTTQGQIDDIRIHDNTSTTRKATHNYDDITAEDHLHDITPPNLMQTLQERVNTLIEGPKEILRKDLNADSHKLAHEVPEVRGAVQTVQPISSSNGPVVRDIGWHKANVEIPDPLIGGYTNGELFSLIRRFNKVGLPVRAGYQKSK